MNTEINFQEKEDMNNYDFSGAPFYPEISENKKYTLMTSMQPWGL